MNLNRIATLVVLTTLVAASNAALADGHGRRSHAAAHGDVTASLRIESSLSEFASQGELRLTLNVDNRLGATHRSGNATGLVTSSGDLRGARDFCVYRNGTGRYRMTIDSANERRGAFRASNGGSFIDYEVRFATDGTGAGGSRLASGQTRGGHTVHSTSLDCGNGENASLNVHFREEDLVGALSGAYVDTLTVTVVPY